MPAVSLCVEEGGQLRVEIVGGDACDVGVGGHHRRQDCATAWLLRLLAKREWGRTRAVFGRVSRGRANAQDSEKKKKKR